MVQTVLLADTEGTEGMAGRMDVLSGEEEKHQAPTLSSGPFMRLCVTSALYTVPHLILRMLMDALASMQPLTSAVLRTHTHRFSK